MDWRDHAACGPDTHDLFFQTSTKAARAICAACPVRDECLQFALDNNEKHGVWGGTTPYRRYLLRKEMTDAESTTEDAD